MAKRETPLAQLERLMEEARKTLREKKTFLDQVLVHGKSTTAEELMGALTAVEDYESAIGRLGKEIIRMRLQPKIHAQVNESIAIQARGTAFQNAEAKRTAADQRRAELEEEERHRKNREALKAEADERGKQDAVINRIPLGEHFPGAVPEPLRSAVEVAVGTATKTATL